MTPAGKATLTINNLEVRLDSSGALSGISLPESNLKQIADAGLWLAGVQDGEVKALVREFSRSNYSARAGDRQLGVFTLTPDSLEDLRITNWPVDYSAPVREDGQPRIFGDMMLWSALLPAAYQPEELYAQPLTGLYVTQAVYGYSAPEFRDVVFMRYEIINDTEGDLTDLYAGFFADIDLDMRRCFSMLANSTGFDTARALSYTYPHEGFGDQDLGCPVLVLGLAFLESPIASEVPQTVSSHTILQKGAGPEYDFSEATLQNPQDVLCRLQGLSSQGDPMIDPTTGMATPYAFTGDPVTETGWLDVPLEVRSLSAAGPFSLAQGQKKKLTVAIVTEQGAVLSEALAQLRQQVDLVSSRPDAWRF
ncbi:MAG TPA: hypothetical protein VKP65_03675 [Rhodothermales bacterium]|nr:hypothetical protein [Rhodothermales bacterium]